VKWASGKFPGAQVKKVADCNPKLDYYVKVILVDELRAALNHAKREELVERDVAELVTLPKARKKPQLRNSWTVDEARRFLESSRRDNDPLYALWVLILTELEVGDDVDVAGVGVGQADAAGLARVRHAAIDIVPV